jgi:multidrug resistance efflux pump
MLRWLISGTIVLAAVGVVLAKYWDYVIHPWTRDGQVMAQVIQITPRVSGPLIQLPVRDNQLVKKGDLLFEIDPRTFEAALDQAKADYATARVKLDNARSEEKQYRNAVARSAGAVSKIELDLKVDSRRSAEAGVLAVQAAKDSAQLDLEFTKFHAPVDGYVTNLILRLGSQAVANQAFLALVDINSFWVHGYFRETVIGDITPGDRAIVTLMTYPHLPLEGRVESLGWGISPDDGSTGYLLLPEISATFEWIRLAQRVPVRIHLVNVPDEVKLRMGTTASVVVLTESRNGDGSDPVPAAPRPLQ